MRQIKKFKEGAASFYIVAIATLILVIIAASFAAVIISELARTSNNDLAQSAYDSAMAGVEDAKLAYSNYLKCVENGGTTDCNEIMKAARSGECDSVANILGRAKGENGVAVTEGEDNKMEQAYTCAILNLTPSDYKTVITSSNPTKTVKVKLADGVAAEDIEAVKVSWKTKQDEVGSNYSNFDDGKVVFADEDSENAASPATIGVGVVQTAGEFSLSDFETTKGEQTNRGMVYLVPTNSEGVQKSENSNYERGEYSEGVNNINKNGLLKSNDKVVQNLPYVVSCPENNSGENGGYTCTAMIELPEPINGGRNDDTFMVMITMPSQGAPETEVSLSFMKGDGTEGGSETIDGGEKITNMETVATSGMQVVVDVTGRANDLYRRVETRLEAPGSGSANLASYALQAIGGIEKIQSAICEVNFISESNCE